MPDEAIEIEALRCRDCGTLDSGPRELCVVCHSARLDRCALNGRGTLVSWTTIRRAPTHLRADVPYTVAVVDLHSGIRITGRLRGDPQTTPPGAEVEAVAREGGAYLFEGVR